MRGLLLITFCLVSGVVSGQTIPAPKIQCASTNSSTGNIAITFDTSTVSNPCGGNFEGYVVYAAQGSPTNSYSVLDTLKNPTTTEFTHKGNGTVLDWFYYMEAIYDCPGATPAQSDTVSEEPLNPPELNRVTVTSANNVLVDWDKSSSSQTFGYKIYYYLGSQTTTIIDTVIGANNTSYTDTLLNPDEPECATYTIDAIDSCRNPSPLNQNQQNTICLKQSKPTACEQVVSLNWNEYVNWPSGLKEYQVRVNTPDSSYVEATVTDTTYELDIAAIPSDSACVKIRAVSNSGVKSNSNETCFSASGVDAVSYNYLTNLTVTKNNKVQSSYIFDTTADINKIRIKRKGKNDDSLKIIRETNPSTNYNFPLTYLDNNINPKNQSFQYRTEISDVCETPNLSNKGRTIHLTVTRGDEFTNELSWNSFELGYATVLNYKLFRNIEGTFVPIATFKPQDSVYIDNVLEQLDTDGSFCYYIRATYRLNLPNGQTSTLESRSNTACIEQATVPIMPNAFTPRGVNNELKPRLIFSARGDYTFQIFNRWGQKVFETNNINEGWDGTYNGSEAETGGYVYRIEFSDSEGNQVKRKGTVILFK